MQRPVFFLCCPQAKCEEGGEHQKKWVLQAFATSKSVLREIISIVINHIEFQKIKINKQKEQKQKKELFSRAGQS